MGGAARQAVVASLPRPLFASEATTGHGSKAHTVESREMRRGSRNYRDVEAWIAELRRLEPHRITLLRELSFKRESE